MGLRTQQMRTIKLMNMHLCTGEDCENNVWPRIEPATKIPEGLAHFEVGSAHKHPNDYCHFYIDDYRFERIWQRPEAYLDTFAKYKGLISPDFSTYSDMPYPMQLWNVYRSRALTYWWQQLGFDVIPVIMSSGRDTRDIFNEGLPRHSVLSASSVGMKRNKRNAAAFAEAMEHACATLEPTALVMYGSRIDFDSHGADVHWYKNDSTERLHQDRGVKA